MSHFDEFEKEFEKVFQKSHEQGAGNDLEEEFKKLFGPPDHEPISPSEPQQELTVDLGGQEEAAALAVEVRDDTLGSTGKGLGDASLLNLEPQLADYADVEGCENYEDELQIIEEPNQAIELDFPSRKLTNLQEITLEQLQLEIDETLIKVYHYFKSQTEELLGFILPEKTLPELYETQLGRYFSIIRQVFLKDGQIKGDAVFAINRILPLLWKAIAEKEYRVPEEWYETDLGYLCRYIKVGNDDSTFDPIDLSAVAVILDYTEDQVIERCKDLGGVKLPSGYVFSRRKIEEYGMDAPPLPPQPPVEKLQEYHVNCATALKQIMTVHRFMANSYLELKQVQTILQSSMNFKNEIPQKVKLFIDGKLAKAYQTFMDVSTAHPINVEVNKGEFLSYSVANVFEPIMNYSGGVLGGMQLVGLLSQSIDMIEGERIGTEARIEQLTKELGRLSTEIEVLRIKENL